MAIEHGDILLQDGSIFGQNGDLAYGDAEEQHIGAILNANTGNFRNWPTLAVNLSRMLNGVNNSRNIAAGVQNALFLDGWKLLNMDIRTGQTGTNIIVEEAIKTTDETSSLT